MVRLNKEEYKNKKFTITFDLETTNQGAKDVLVDLWKYIQTKDWAIKNLDGSGLNKI